MFDTLRLSPAALVLTSLCLAAPMTAAAQEPLETVEYVDLERYLGLWYEIATIPALFEAGCTATTATYTLRDDGLVGVANACNMFWVNGPERVANGRAAVVDESNAILAVTFGPGTPTVANYYIMDLDPDYQWAVVGEPSRNYLWILSRTSNMSPALYQDLLDGAEAQGYDVTTVEKTRHPRN